MVVTILIIAKNDWTTDTEPLSDRGKTKQYTAYLLAAIGLRNIYLKSQSEIDLIVGM